MLHPKHQSFSPRWRTRLEERLGLDEDYWQLRKPSQRATSVQRVKHRSFARRWSPRLQKCLDHSAEYAQTLHNYVYLPLKPGDIRVLDLLSRPGAKLRCRIRHVAISGPAQHVALSYVWGDSRKPFWIPVVGRKGNRFVGRIYLTVSLRDALQDLRDCEYFQHLKTFWIDQLCINQSDDVEKNLQVAQMMRIYETARETVTYMGPEERKDEEALLLLDRIYRFYKAKMVGDTADPNSQQIASLLQDITANPSIHYLRYKQYGDVPLELRLEGNIASLDREIYEHLGDTIISSSWNQRVWLVQENVANPQAGFLRGPYFFTWGTVGMLAALACVGVLPEFDADYNVARLLELRLARFKNDSTVDTHEVVLYSTIHRHSQDRTCSDIRDKIYAVMGLSRDVRELGILPDYEKCPAQVFTDLAVAYIHMYHRYEAGYELSVLEWVGKDPSPDPLFPSWVPSFTSPRQDWPARSSAASGPISNTRIVDVRASFEHHKTIGNAILVTKGVRLSRLAEKLGTLTTFLFWTQKRLTQTITTLDKAHARLGEGDMACASLSHTLLMDANWPEDPVTRTTTAAEAFRGLKGVLKLASEGAHIKNHEHPDLFYLPTATPEVDPQVAYLIKNTCAGGRALWLMENGSSASVPDTVRADDVPVVLFGGPFVHFLRASGKNKFRYMGCGYVHGFMNGEAVSPGWEERIETFRIE